MKPVLPKYLLFIWVAIVAFGMVHGCDNPPSQSSDPRPAIAGATTTNADEAKILAQQNQSLAADNATLAKQNAQLQRALDDAGESGTLIDKAQVQRAKAAAAGTSIPAVTSNLGDQKLTLDQLKATNADLQDQLATSKADNKTLSDSNTSLTARNNDLTGKNAAMASQLKQAATQAAQSEGEKADLVKENGDLKEKIASGEREKLDFYFGLSIAITIAGIAGVIWIPSPAKRVGYVILTVGVAGLGVTIFLIAWMAWLKWIMLAAFVGGLACVAYQLFMHHGALTKTAEGVQGIKEDLAAVAASAPVQAVRDEATKIYTDYFGGVTSAGIFHYLHSEYSSIIGRIRSLIGTPKASKVSAPTANFLTATVAPITPKQGASA